VRSGLNPLHPLLLDHALAIAGESGQKLRKALDEFDRYIVVNQSLIPNYGERWRNEIALQFCKLRFFGIFIVSGIVGESIPKYILGFSLQKAALKLCHKLHYGSVHFSTNLYSWERNSVRPPALQVRLHLFSHASRAQLRRYSHGPETFVLSRSPDALRGV
jgi:hypothetical protein